MLCPREGQGLVERLPVAAREGKVFCCEKKTIGRVREVKELESQGEMIHQLEYL